MASNPDPIDVHVGERIRTLRKTRKVSQEGLAKALGLTFQQIQKYERASNRVSSSMLFHIAAHLGEPISYFFDGLDTLNSGGASEFDARASSAMNRVPAISLIDKLTLKECSALDGIITSMAGAR